MSKHKLPTREELAQSEDCGNAIMPNLLAALSNNVVKKGGQQLTVEQRNEIELEINSITDKKWYDCFVIARQLAKFPYLKVDEDTVFALSQVTAWVKKYCDEEIAKAAEEIKKEYMIGDIVAVALDDGKLTYAAISSFQEAHTVNVRLLSTGIIRCVPIEYLIGRLDVKDMGEASAALRHVCVNAGIRLGLLSESASLSHNVFTLRKLLRFNASVDAPDDTDPMPVAVQYRDYLPGQEVYSSKFKHPDGSYEKLTVLVRKHVGYEVCKDKTLSYCHVYDNDLLIPMPEEGQHVCFYDSPACTTVRSGIVKRTFKELRKADVAVLKKQATCNTGDIVVTDVITINLIDIIPSLTGLNTFIGRNE